MIPVLLVDDEVLALGYLERLIDWQVHGFYIAGTATSARKALELCDVLRPRLVISDIRMPMHDGLYLCEKIKEKTDDIIILLLSAYRDFDYAQKAIAFGVSNYLLKHELNAESLLFELGKVKRTFAQSNENRRFEREKQLNGLLFEAPENIAIPKWILPYKRFTLLMLRRDEPFILTHNASIPRRNANESLHSFWETWGEHNTGPLNFLADSAIDDQHHVILLAETEGGSEQRRIAFIEEMIRQVTVECVDEPETMSALYSPCIIRERMHQTFRELSHAMRYYVFLGRSFCRAYQLLPISPTENQAAFGPTIAELRLALAQGQDLAPILSVMFLQTEKPEWNITALRQLCHLLLHEIGNVDELLREALHGQFQQCWCLQDIQDVVLQVFRKYQEKQLEALHYSSTVKRALAYLQQHYQKSITLDTLGEQLGVHGSYLGHLFRNDVGITFLKYLTQVRVDKAKALLQDGKYNVSEVAELVGYKTSQYFATIFQKETGVTPHQFKTRGNKECE